MGFFRPVSHSSFGPSSLTAASPNDNPFGASLYAASATAITGRSDMATTTNETTIGRSNMGTTTNDTTITGLREQIFAKAAFVFPSVIKELIAKHRIGSVTVEADEVFDIVVTESTKSQPGGFGASLGGSGALRYFAAVVYGDPTAPKTAAVGPKGGSFEDALKLLLGVLARAGFDGKMCHLENLADQGGCVDEACRCESS